jgi:hypothetical protein
MFRALLEVIDVDAAAMRLLSRGFAVDKKGCREGELHVLHTDKVTLLGQLADHHKMDALQLEDRVWLEKEISAMH